MPTKSRNFRSPKRFGTEHEDNAPLVKKEGLRKEGLCACSQPQKDVSALQDHLCKRSLSRRMVTKRKLMEIKLN